MAVPRRVLVVTCLALSVGVPAAAASLSPAAVLRGVWAYDNRAVSVTGTLARAQVWISPGGARYYRFELAEGRSALPVLAPPVVRCEAGRPATVDGMFRRLFVVDGVLLERVLEAARVECTEAPEDDDGG
ncbi:MAG: hypothetical protein FJ027_21640 [Candidatus Rokubacteria bacterium]|nr:hypothetical protein [Candidatus Rokubacteria bacterium]